MRHSEARELSINRFKPLLAESREDPYFSDCREKARRSSSGGAGADSTRRSSSARVRPTAPFWVRTKWRAAAPRAAAASGSFEVLEEHAGQLFGVGDLSRGLASEQLFDRVAEVGRMRPNIPTAP